LFNVALSPHIAMHSEHCLVDERISYPLVDVTDPLEVARWSWLLKVSELQIRHAVSLVGNDSEAVARYIELFCRPSRSLH
jgi:hypothetical protein